MGAHLSRSVLACVFVTSLFACPKQVPPPDVKPDPVREFVKPVEAVPKGPGLVVHVEPTDAELIIDGESQGSVSSAQVKSFFFPLRTGIYQVALKRSGFLQWRAEVTIRENPEALNVTLVKAGDTGRVP
jgi:hypothetical protein